MQPEAIPLFLNPAAGRGRAARHLGRLCELFDEAGVPVAVQQSAAVGDLEQQVFELAGKGAERIVVAGGDGSVHEAVNGIMRAGATTALGLVPIGTGNDFAKACDIPLEWEHATTLLARRLLAGTAARRIDLGRMNGRYFANGAGIGFDARVTRHARGWRLPIGELVYLFALLRCLLDGIATPQLRIETEDGRREGPVTLASFANGAWIGGMFHIAPMADNADGRLDLVIAAPVTRRRLLGLLPKLIRGQHTGEAEFTHLASRRATIRANNVVDAHLDGEVQPLQQRFEIEILPGALQLL